MMTPMIGFIMLPIYTSHLSPAEYGVMTTIQTLVGMLQLFLLLSLHGAVTRFYYDYSDDPHKLKAYLGSIFNFTLIFSTGIVALLLLFDDIITSILFKQIPKSPYYYYLLAISWCSALFALPMALYRAQEKAGTFVLINAIKAFAIMGLTIYLLIIQGFGAESALISQAVVTFIVVLITYGKQLKYFSFSLNPDLVKQSLMFSLPLLPHVASGWIINSSDRVILEKFIPIADLGVYALAVQVSMILSLFYSSVNNALVPRYTKLRKDGLEEQATKLLRVFLYIVIFFGLLSIPVAITAVQLLASEVYQQANILIPFLLIAQIIKGIYFIPTAKLFYIKKTKSIATSSVIAALCNIIINIIMIPIIGVYGAILSTITAEVIRILLLYRASKEKIQVHY